MKLSDSRLNWRKEVGPQHEARLKLVAGGLHECLEVTVKGVEPVHTAKPIKDLK